MEPSGNLIISRVIFDDKGEYMCLSSNKHGTIQGIARVIVRRKLPLVNSQTLFYCNYPLEKFRYFMWYTKSIKMKLLVTVHKSRPTALEALHHSSYNHGNCHHICRYGFFMCLSFSCRENKNY